MCETIHFACPCERSIGGSVGAHCICAHAQPPQPPEPGSQRARVRADIQSAPTGAVGGLPRPQRPAGRCGHRPLRRRGPLNCRATSAAHPRWVRRGRDSVSFWLRQNRGSNPIPSIKNQHARKGRVGFLANDPNCDTSEPPLALGGSFCAKGVHNLILRWNNLTI